MHHRRHLALLVFGCAIASLSSPTGAEAQTASPREGVWGNVTLGLATVSCDACGSIGLQTRLALGWTVSDRVRLGIAGDLTWSSYHNVGEFSTSDGTNVLATVAPFVRFYPNEAGDFFLLAGAGLGITNIDDPDVFLDLVDPKFGVGLIVGLGYDIRGSGSGVAVTPLLRGAWIGTSDPNATLLEIGFGLTFG